MSSSSDTLQFCFPTHGDSILSKMNALRKRHLFCDITLLLGAPPGATVQPLHFHGHRVVLAASSDFLRDQFLLHEGLAELCVAVVSSVEIGRRLLLSCYTGLLEVPLRELVSYLTAASALQMSQVVEKCAQAVSQYLSPSLAFLTVERHSEKKEILQPDRLNSQEEPSNQEAMLRVSQGAKMENKSLREVRDDKREIIAEIGPYEDAACCLQSEENQEIQTLHTTKTSDQDDHITSPPRCNPHTAVREHTSSPTRGLEDSSQNQDGESQAEQKGEEEMLLLATQLQQCGELMDSNLFFLSEARLLQSPCSPDEPTEDSDRLSVQRPYLCRRCDRVFQHLESYVGHLKEHRQYLCLLCGKGFSHKGHLSQHIRVHVGVKPFRCPLCHKTFCQKATLQDHLNLHTGNRPHRCNYCAVHFAHKPGLRRHLKAIHGKSSLQNMLEEGVD